VAVDTDETLVGGDAPPLGGSASLEHEVVKGNLLGKLFGIEKQVKAGRWILEDKIGEGGMGVVFAARDPDSGRRVAVKIMSGDKNAPGPGQRFAREVQALASLDHPGVVEYVGHGETEKGAPFLVMEWLQGIDLEGYLASHGALCVDDVITLGARLAETLAAAHAGGIIHRDIKPSNIFIPAEGVSGTKILDFGIARLSMETRGLTATGHMVGTPGYMSPEQARGSRELDARTDLFSLGCVLYEALSGEAPFQGAHVMAILARVLLEDSPPVSQACPSVPGWLDAVILALMEKLPARRPASASVVAAMLSDREAPSAERSGGTQDGLSTEERSILSVLLVRLEAANAVGADGRDWRASIAPILESADAQSSPLYDGSLLVTLSSIGASTDQAARAAGCALRILAELPAAAIVLVSGQGQLSKGSIVGQVLDRGAAALEAAAPGEIRLDDTTAGLLDPRFELVGDQHGLRLAGLIESSPPVRMLMGRATPFVGRSRELGGLEALLDECVSDSQPSLALVVAEAGVGKSRLRYEFARRAQKAHPTIQVLMGRGDAVSSHAPFGLLSRLLRRGAGVRDGESRELQRQKIETRLTRHMDDESRRRNKPFLAELAGVRAGPESPSQGQRLDAQDFRNRMRFAWEDMLASESADHPVLIVLEDLHWGDHATVAFIEGALRNLDDSPVMVLALARPEIDEAFPKVWAQLEPERIELPPLTRKACRKLARDVLADASKDTVDRLVNQSEGNAFFLEELLRMASDGESHALPETVIAMTQDRLKELPSAERRVLRAASVFGETFWAGGAALLCESIEGQEAKSLSALEAVELIARQPGSTVPGEQEYRFRHALVRDAAYAMLTDDDRVTAHRLAGEWLEQAGMTEGSVLAKHFDHGGVALTAARWYLAAAEQALEADVLEDALAWSRRADTLGVEADARQRLLAIQAHALFWTGQHEESAKVGRLALGLLPVGEGRWFRAAEILCRALGRGGRFGELEVLTDRLLAKEPVNIHARADQALTLCAAADGLTVNGVTVRVRAVVQAIETLADASEETPLRLRAAFARLRSSVADQEGDPWEAYGWNAKYVGFVAQMDPRDDSLAALSGQGERGHMQAQLGLNTEAMETLTRAVKGCQRLGLNQRSFLLTGMIGLLYHRQGRLEEAQRILKSTWAYEHAPDPRIDNSIRLTLSVVERDLGNLEQAIELAEHAARDFPPSGPLVPWAYAELARHFTAAGRVDDAVEAATKALKLAAGFGTISEFDTIVQVAYVEALDAAGDQEAAREALRGFHAKLMLRADRVGDAAVRDRFLGGVPCNARIVELAEVWGLVSE
jgi:serine/threonine protein kinase/tetratricopeptide (TPR) repeat protein